MDDRLSQKSRRSRLLRIAVAVAVLGLSGAAGFAGYLQATRFENFLVSGPSMAPTFWGPSRQFVCATCGWRSRVVEIGELSPAAPMCFRCGCRDGNQLSELRVGDEVEVDRAAYWLAQPQRKDCVAIEKPTGGLQVKRIVGLPGDVVRIDSQGQVFVNGEAWRLPSLRDAINLMQPGAEVYQHSDQLGSLSRLVSHDDWWVYHHRDNYNRGLPDVIRDDNPINLRLSRQTLPVEHLFVSLVIRSDGNGVAEFACGLSEEVQRERVKLVGGVQRIVMEFDGGKWNVLLGESEIGDVDGAAASGLELSPQRPIGFRFVGADGAMPESARLESFWLGRGARFDPPRELQERWLDGVRIPDGCFFVLGDNGPASEDSRHTLDGVERERIVGKVKLATAD